MDGESVNEGPADKKKRAFLKTAVVASGALALGGAAAVIVGTIYQVQKEEPKPIVFPRFRISDETTGEVANVNTLAANKPLVFNYPLDDEPNILVKLGQKAESGVGPNQDIVAFSNICQHLGCVLGYLPQGGSPPCDSEYIAQQPQLFCCCHWGIYNLLDDAALTGPSVAVAPVPRVLLEVDGKTGDIYAAGMTPPVIYGKSEKTGSDDIALDLVGGTLVKSS